MILTRRQFVVAGAGMLAALAALRQPAARPVAVIEMRGTARGERVWFRPLGLAVAPGTTVRFVNRDPVNSHTATAYHPDLFGRASRIPDGAAPWDSGFLLPGDRFAVTLEVPGVYDYYCLPHEMGGMVGRIVVARPETAGWQDAPEVAGDMPETAWQSLPPVAAILAQGRIDPEERP